MQQTLLALTALFAAMSLSFSQMQGSAWSQKRSIRAETEQMALGVAMQTMEVVRARAFDAATLGVPDEEHVSPSKFTAENDFGIMGDCKLYSDGSGTNCEAIEDFHGTTGEVPFPLADDTFRFTVDIEVRYVCATLEPASTSGACAPPTSRKEVLVKVQDTQPDGVAHRLPEPIEYSQVLAYP